MGEPLLQNDTALFRNTVTPFDTVTVDFSSVTGPYTVESRSVLSNPVTVGARVIAASVPAASSIVSKFNLLPILIFPLGKFPAGGGFLAILSGPNAGYDHISTTIVPTGVSVNFD